MDCEYNLENVEFKPIYLFFKFGSKDRLEQLQKDGYVYMKNLKYFVEEEIKTLKRGKGDRYEARLFQATSVKILDIETDKVLLEIGDTTVADSRELKKPVFCTACLNIFDKVTSFEYPKFESEISFDTKMVEDFSPDVEPFVLVIHDIQEFLNRVKLKLDGLNLNYKYEMVRYRNTGYIYKGNDGVEFNTAFDKDTYFSYQSEWRLLIDTEVENFYDITLGSIADISSLLPAKSVISGIRIKGYTGEPVALND